MISKKSPKQLSTSRKLSVLLALLENRFDLSQVAELSAPEMRSLRDFLLEQILHISKTRPEAVSRPKVDEKFEPIPNYFHRQACREPLDACYQETCMASNPICFTRKMTAQIEILISELQPFLVK